MEDLLIPNRIKDHVANMKKDLYMGTENEILGDVQWFKPFCTADKH